MPLYLTPIIGTGTDLDPFQPVWTGAPGQGWIDLRPDSTVNAGIGVLYLPTARADARLTKVADVADEVLSIPNRNRIQNAFGVTLTATQFQHILAELLVIHARTDGTRWKPLQFTIQGLLEIWLGSLGRIYAQPAITGGASFSETWPTNGTNIATGQDQPWNEDDEDVTVVSNHLELAVASVGPPGYGRCTSAVATDNHIVQATCLIAVSDADAKSIGVTARKVNSTVQTFYFCRFQRSSAGGETNRDLGLRNSGAFTLLYSDTTDAGGSALTVSCTCNGSSISGVIGALSISPVTNTLITGNLLGGYEIKQTGGTLADTQLDNWSIADLQEQRGIHISSAVGAFKGSIIPNLRW